MIRSQMMSRIGAKNTVPAMKIRRGLHRRGFRYRLHLKDLPGKPDIVLPGHNVVIMVHGCFWHGRRGCRYFKHSRANTDFWQSKIQKNHDRDDRQIVQPASLGWRVLVILECATRNNPVEDPMDAAIEWMSGNASKYELAEHTSASEQVEQKTT